MSAQQPLASLTLTTQRKQGKGRKDDTAALVLFLLLIAAAPFSTVSFQSKPVPTTIVGAFGDLSSRPRRPEYATSRPSLEQQHRHVGPIISGPRRPIHLPRLSLTADSDNNDRVSFSTSSSSFSSPSPDGNNNSEKRRSKMKKKTVLTLGDLAQQVLRNPAKYAGTNTVKGPKKQASGTKRTRKKVENPQQQYLYKSQRLQQQQQQQTMSKTTTGKDENEQPVAASAVSDAITIQKERMVQVAQIEFGLQPLSQHCDPLLGSRSTGPLACPQIVGRLCVDAMASTTLKEDDDYDHEDVDSSAQELGTAVGSRIAVPASSMAFLIDKPAGWSILGAVSAKRQEEQEIAPQQPRKKHDEEALSTMYERTIHVKDEDSGNLVDVITYSELDVMALLTPEELEEYLQEERAEGNDLPLPTSTMKQNRSISGSGLLNQADDVGMYDDLKDVDEEEEDEKDDPDRIVSNSGTLRPETQARLDRIQARLATLAQDTGRARFQSTPRPSVVSWLKQNILETTGVPIRGGNFWVAVAGATAVDDSGLVLICPRQKVNNLHVDFAEYVAVVGNGGDIAPTTASGNTKSATAGTGGKGKSKLESQTVQLDTVAKLRKGRGDDVVQVVQVRFVEGASTSNSAVDVCQEGFQDGIRGDPAANPLDRRASRRLVHCQELAASSLVVDESVQARSPELPDDIAVLSERRNHLEYKKGSFLGRAWLCRNKQVTNAWREINGAADGFPGWTVDRYGSYLLVQHDPKQPRGPLPSIHDGNTAGVYYLESDPDRSSMNEVKPILLEGKAAPDIFSIVENGVQYLVSLNRDLSTGIFLDQRPQRAWLIRNCCSKTRVLNCFAHTGAYSVAAAAAGASTVSIDLSKKWLDRFPQHLQVNGIPFDERHDCIYGDCFEWLARLSKRGEKFDIVILDPPSASVGGRKKKRWSVKNDMDELVAQAATLVKKGGLLWTTTNSASISALKFARLCKKGLDGAGIATAKLERVQPMPSDFQTIGPQPVKNLVWRIS